VNAEQANAAVDAARRLRRALYRAAKARPARRFHAIYDKVSRTDSRVRENCPHGLTRGGWKRGMAASRQEPRKGHTLRRTATAPASYSTPFESDACRYHRAPRETPFAPALHQTAPHTSTPAPSLAGQCDGIGTRQAASGPDVAAILAGRATAALCTLPA